MQKTVYFAVKIIVLDEDLALISYKMPSFIYNFPRTTLDAEVNFLCFYGLKGLGQRTLIKQFLECCQK